MTQAEVKKQINAIAKEKGFIMRKQNATLNGQQLYKFESRNSGKTIFSNMTIGSAFDNAKASYQFLDQL